MDVVSTSSLPSGPEPDPHTREVAERLLNRALLNGNLPRCVTESIQGFQSGNTALFVGGVSAITNVVVKADHRKKVLHEALFLRRAAEDLRLPQALRDALPKVYAIEPDGPPYAYLMEYLNGYRRLTEYMIDRRDRCDVPEILGRLWAILAETYRTTRSTRLRPNVEEDYVGRVDQRLVAAADRQPLLAPHRPVKITVDGETVELPAWPEVIARARLAAATLAPDFATFVLGDPNLDNILVRRVGAGFEIKLIDPKEWELGDWLFDIAKMAQCLQVTLPVEAGLLAEPPRSTDTGAAIEIAYDLPVPQHVREADGLLLTLVESFATAHDDDAWARRYGLGIGTILLANVPRRLASDDEIQRHLGVVAFAEGLSRVWAASQPT